MVIDISFDIVNYPNITSFFENVIMILSPFLFQREHWAMHSQSCSP